jgi:Na+-driven multidrug efflux pump
MRTCVCVMACTQMVCKWLARPGPYLPIRPHHRNPQVCDYVAYFCSVIGIATTNLAADAFARGEPATAKRVIGGSLTLSLTIGMLVSALVYTSAGPVMTAMLGGGAAPAAVASAATEYTSIRALGYPAALLTMTLQAAFIAMQDSRSPLLAIPLVACANLIGDLLLVKPLGAAGAAWATTVALYINAAALLAMWRRKVQTIGGRHVLFAVPTKREARRLLGFAAPMIVALSARVCLGLSITLSAVAIGTTALAANQIIESLYWLFCPFGEAISLSMQAFLPPLLLKGRSLARRLQCTAFRVAGVLGAAAGGFALLLPLAVPGVFTTSAVVASSAQLSAPFLGFSLFSFVFLAATEGMLIARKELRPLAASHVVNTLLFGALLYYASHTPGCALHHIWALLGVCNLWRVFQFRFLLDREDRAALAERSREPRRWRRALRALRLRLAIRRRRRREEVHEVIPDVEEIAPHLF